MINDELQDALDSQSFRNNTNLRPEGMEIGYTEEMIYEYIKCREDPLYFIENYIHVVHPDRGVVKMQLYEYQKRMILAYHDNRFVAGITARQMGKCSSENTKVSIKNRKTNKMVELTLGELYVWQKFKQEGRPEDLQKVQF